MFLGRKGMGFLRGKDDACLRKGGLGEGDVTGHVADARLEHGDEEARRYEEGDGLDGVPGAGAVNVCVE